MSITHETMHRDHRLWESEIKFWRDDLHAWQQELAQARNEIKELEQALEKHANTLREHGSAIRLEEQTFDTHEHAIVQYEKGGTGTELLEMARQHGVEADRHAAHRDDHERLKRHHHSIITCWKMFHTALCGPLSKKEAVPQDAKPKVISS